MQCHSIYLPFQRNEEYSDKWDIVRLRHVPFTVEQLQERSEAQAEVDDSSYLANLAAADADGDAEAEVPTGTGLPMAVDEGENFTGLDAQVKAEKKPKEERYADAEVRNDVQKQMKDEVFGGESDSDGEGELEVRNNQPSEQLVDSYS